jgi:hypothetical protein
VAAIEQRFEENMRALDARFEERFQALASSIAQAMSASDRAITKAEVAADKRYEALNELRGMANDTLARTMTRDESEQRFASMAEKLDAITARMDRRDGGGAGLHQGWLILVGLVVMASALFGIIGFFGGGAGP